MKSAHCNEGQHQWCGGLVDANNHKAACECACHNVAASQPEPPPEESEDSICFDLKAAA